MSEFFQDCHRELQDRHDTRRLADRREQVIVHDRFYDEEIAFIETRDMFFLATAEPGGEPTVSYKGGKPGFVRIEDNLLTFPCYDGNGMFRSMGNVTANPKVGLLFIDFETSRRVRVQGISTLDYSAAKDTHPGAIFLAQVSPTRIFVNCPRYIHRYRRVETSHYVPDDAGNAPIAQWKRLAVVRDVLPEAQQAGAAKAGEISQEEYEAKAAHGEG